MKRRTLLKSCSLMGFTGFACGTGFLMSGSASATASDPFQATSVDAVFAALGVNDAEVSDQIQITAPKIAENGASVPVAITSFIGGTTEIITIVAENPKPLAARNKFGKNAITAVSTRIKMGQTTDVIAVVRAGGRHYMAKTGVKVTLGGCGG